VVVSGLSEAEKLHRALAPNVLRRQLGPIAWAAVYRRLAEAEGIRLGSGKGSPSPKAAHAAALARRLGVSPRAARQRLQLATALQAHPDLGARVDAGEVPPRRAVAIAREREARARTDPPWERMPDAVDLRLGDFREVLADLPDSSVDLVFTDPPYLGSTIEVYGDLGAFAGRVLAPDGLLLAEVGAMFLPEAIALLRGHLYYRWCIAVVLPRKRPRVHARRVINGWRSILVFAREGASGRWLYDTHTVEEPPDKRWHRWEKPLGPARYYIGQLSRPGDLVVDPFVGSGTTAVAALAEGRRFVGCDIDPEALKAARVRVDDAARGGL